MDEKKKEIKYDLESYEALTNALRELVNQYPGLEEGEHIAFATLDEAGGIAMYPGAEAIIEDERRSVTGKVRQTCRYPFYVVYRAGGLSENNKAATKEWLDALACWLEQVRSYPTLTGGRRLLGISILSPGYLYSVDESKTETWAVELAARYEKEFRI